MITLKEKTKTKHALKHLKQFYHEMVESKGTTAKCIPLQKCIMRIWTLFMKYPHYLLS